MKFFANGTNGSGLVAVWLLSSLASAGVREQPAEPEVNRELAHDTVSGVAAAVEQEYFDPAMGARAAEALRQNLDTGRYAEAETPESLAKMLTHDLHEMTRDKHLAIAVVPEPEPAESESEACSDCGLALRAERARKENYGIRQVRILAGNVGYLDVTSFYRPEEAHDVIFAAMRLLRGADALILDLRDHGGGSPGTLALLASFLFDEPGLPLAAIVPRSGGAQVYTTSDPPVPDRNEARPVFVLTSKRTFSAGEGLAFILQERGRAEIVGEQTPGAANPGRPYPVNALFEVTVPNGRVRTAVTGRNWEGSGVTPDLTVPAEDALCAAHIRALEALRRLRTPPCHPGAEARKSTPRIRSFPLEASGY